MHRSVGAALRVPRDVVAPFAASPRFARGPVLPAVAEDLRTAWVQHTATKPGRDFLAIDESGDFDPLTGPDEHPFLVGAVVGFDRGTYSRLARMFYPWRHHVFADEEVKASAPHHQLPAAVQESFFEELGGVAHSGICAVTVGFIDKVSHRGGILLEPGFDKVAVRRDFHRELLRTHATVFSPRTRNVGVYIDRCGLTGPQATDYGKTVRGLYESLSLNVGTEVQFVDSLMVEMVQLADLLAGIARRRFDDPALADPEELDKVAAGLGRRFLLGDLTIRP